MRKAVLIALLALAAGVLSFQATRGCRPVRPQHALLDEMPELAWMRGELKLSDAQFARVAALHERYRPVCRDMCDRIETARARVDGLLRQSKSVTPELESAMREFARVRAECRLAMLRHVYETAAELDERQAARYLDALAPHLVESGPAGEAGHPH
jgi:hypothetical protein